MKQIEVTTYVKNTLEEVDKILTSQGFKIIRKSHIEDIYKTTLLDSLNKNNILDILSKSILIRYNNVNGEKELKKMTYKKKVYDHNIVITEEKISINIDDINTANKLLEEFNFKTLVNVKYDAIVYSNGKIELCFQDVYGLGLLLEYENEKDFDGYSVDEIINEKHRMLDEIKSYKLNITDDFDVKKAYELIMKSFI